MVCQGNRLVSWAECGAGTLNACVQHLLTQPWLACSKRSVDDFRWLTHVACWHCLPPAALSPAAGGTAAELVLGMAPATIGGTPTSATSAATSPAAVAGVSDGGAFEVPVLTSADWMRRGALAERLGHTLDARSAYRAAVKLSFNLTSYLALMRLEAEADSTGNTALCAAQILGWHQQRAGQPQAGSGGSGGGSGQAADHGSGTSASATSGGAAGSTAAAAGSGGVVLVGVPPSDVVWALGLVADGSSADAVRRVVTDVHPAAQAALLAIMDEWARWQAVQVQPALAARQLRRR